MSTARRPFWQQLHEISEMLNLARYQVYDVTGCHNEAVIRGVRVSPPKHGATDLYEFNGVWMAREDLHDRLRRLG